MPIHQLNHAVLYVRDLPTSVAFYRDVLGFRIAMELPGRAAFLQAEGSTNDHDLGLFQLGANAGPSAAGRSTVGLYHLAWEVDTLADLRAMATALQDAGALGGASDHATTKALYARDPDGLEFEVSWLVPADRLDEVRHDTGGEPTIAPLDLDAEIARWGADTPGGIGVSRPAPARAPDTAT